MSCLSNEWIMECILSNVMSLSENMFSRFWWKRWQEGLFDHKPRLCYKVKSVAAAATAKSLQSCPNLCNPIDSCPSSSTIPGILQARTLEWVAISFSTAWKWKAKVKSLNRIRLLATPWTAAYQPPPSMGFSRQEYWSGVPLPSLVKSVKKTKFWYPVARTAHDTSKYSINTFKWVNENDFINLDLFNRVCFILPKLCSNPTKLLKTKFKGIWVMQIFCSLPKISLDQWSLTFFAVGTHFMENSFPTDQERGLFQGDSNLLHLLCTFSLVQSSSVTQSCPTPCYPMDWSMPGFPVHHQLLQLTQTQVHRIGNAIQPSHPLSFPSPPAFNPSQHQGLLQWVCSLYQVAKVVELQLKHLSFRRIFWTDLL